jgi:hypothetical protein
MAVSESCLQFWIFFESACAKRRARKPLDEIDDARVWILDHEV